ncbi:MAG: hypothetical protein AB1773_15585 [Pseudomonadota bacterium]
MARNDRRAIERSVKERLADGGRLVLPILSPVTEAPGAAPRGWVRCHGSQGGRVPLEDRQLRLRRPRLRDSRGEVARLRPASA